MRTLILMISGLLLASPALAEEEEARRRVREVARGYDARDPGAAARARAVLESIAPDTWIEHLPPGWLRHALVTGLSKADVLAAFERAGQDPVHGLTRWSALASALTPRKDLAKVLTEAKAVDPLAAHHPEVVIPIAVEGLIDGDPGLALRLLARPELTDRVAGLLLQMNRPEGLRLVIDLLRGLHPLPIEARARLGHLEPDTHNDRIVREIGEERIRALERLAAEHRDPAWRILAARLLSFSLDGEAYAAAVRAYRDANSADVTEDEWEVLGKHFVSSWSDASVRLAAREQLLRGHFYRGYLFADGAPVYTERATARLRAMVAEESDPRFRGMMLRFLDLWSNVFVDSTHIRLRPVPSFMGLLDDLEQGRPDDPKDLRVLAGGLVDRIRWSATTEARARNPWGSHRPADDVASPVHALVPRKEQVPDDPRPMVRKWIETDPQHLFDAEVAKKLGDLRSFERKRIMEAYPADDLRGMLARPPSRFGKIRRQARGDDLTGARNRMRLLELLVDAPAHAGLILTFADLPDWHPESRFQAGRVLQGQGDRKPVLPLLEDDHLLAGFLCQALLRPAGDDLTRAAKVVTGADSRPAALLRMADWMLEEMPERLGPRDDEDWPNPAEPVSDGLREKLGERLRLAPDPAVAWLAARVLALSGTPEDLDVILRFGGDLEVGVSRGWHAFTDLAFRVDSAHMLDLVLSGLERREVPPRARLELFIFLVGARFPPSLHEELVGKLETWIRERLQKLDGDLPEHMLAALVKWTEDDSKDRAKRLYLDTIERIPLEEMRIRLHARSLEWD